MKIRYIQHHNIDKALWDACVEASGTDLIYAKSWYLDSVAPNWNALVCNNYEAVMPLPVKRFFGFGTVVQPRFCQQLGVFAVKPELNNPEYFLNAVPKYFLNVCQSLNYSCVPPLAQSESRINHILSLEPDYNTLWQHFSTNTKRNLKKVAESHFSLDSAITVEEFLRFKRQHPTNKLTNSHFATLHHLLNQLLGHSVARITGVRNLQGQLLCAACLVQYRNRITYLMAASSEMGKEQHAMFFLIDAIIRENAGHKKVLDFEGSMIPGVARFFKGFGATVETYWYYRKRKWPVF